MSWGQPLAQIPRQSGYYVEPSQSQQRVSESADRDDTRRIIHDVVMRELGNSNGNNTSVSFTAANNSGNVSLAPLGASSQPRGNLSQQFLGSSSPAPLAGRSPVPGMGLPRSAGVAPMGVNQHPAATTVVMPASVGVATGGSVRGVVISPNASTNGRTQVRNLAQNALLENYHADASDASAASMQPSSPSRMYIIGGGQRTASPIDVYDRSSQQPLGLSDGFTSAPMTGVLGEDPARPVVVTSVGGVLEFSPRARGPAPFVSASGGSIMTPSQLVVASARSRASNRGAGGSSPGRLSPSVDADDDTARNGEFDFLLQRQELEQGPRIAANLVVPAQMVMPRSSPMPFQQRERDRGAGGGSRQSTPTRTGSALEHHHSASRRTNSPHMVQPLKRLGTPAAAAAAAAAVVATQNASSVSEPRYAAATQSSRSRSASANSTGGVPTTSVVYRDETKRAPASSVPAIALEGRQLGVDDQQQQQQQQQQRSHTPRTVQEIAELRDTIERLERDIGECFAQSTASENGLRAELAAAQAREAAAAKRAEELEERLRESKRVSDEVAQRAERLEAALREERDGIRFLQDAVARKETQLQEYEARLREAETSIEEATHAVAEARRRGASPHPAEQSTLPLPQQAQESSFSTVNTSNGAIILSNTSPGAARRSVSRVSQSASTLPGSRAVSSPPHSSDAADAWEPEDWGLSPYARQIAASLDTQQAGLPAQSPTTKHFEERMRQATLERRDARSRASRSADPSINQLFSPPPPPRLQPAHRALMAGGGASSTSRSQSAVNDANVVATELLRGPPSGAGTITGHASPPRGASATLAPDAVADAGEVSVASAANSSSSYLTSRRTQQGVPSVIPLAASAPGAIGSTPPPVAARRPVAASVSNNDISASSSHINNTSAASSAASTPARRTAEDVKRLIEAVESRHPIARTDSGSRPMDSPTPSSAAVKAAASASAPSAPVAPPQQEPAPTSLTSSAPAPSRNTAAATPVAAAVPAATAPKSASPVPAAFLADDAPAVSVTPPPAPAPAVTSSAGGGTNLSDDAWLSDL